MHSIGVLLDSTLFGQTALNLTSSVLLVPNSQLKFLDLFLQSSVFIMEGIDKFLDVDALVT